MRRYLRPAMLMLGFLFIFILMMHSWDELKLASISIPLFVLSIIVAVSGNFVTSVFFKKLLSKYGAQVDFQLNHKLFFYGQIAKYIPGKIWSLVFQSTMIPKPGTNSAILFANLDLLVIQISNCTIIAVAVLALKLNIYLAIFVFILGLAICIMLGRSCAAFSFTGGFPYYSKYLQKYKCKCNPNVPLVVLLSYYGLFWLTYFGAHILLLFSAFDFSGSQIVFYVAILCLSWVVGVITLVSPAGLGVREVVFMFLAQYTMQDVSIETVAAIAVLARVWFVLQELLGATMVYAYSRYQRQCKNIV